MRPIRKDNIWERAKLTHVSTIALDAAPKLKYVAPCQTDQDVGRASPSNVVVIFYAQAADFRVLGL